eukprot:CAMPEP_0167763032 /NCGR_PEP_ID=MMETSP0110_2-20121227/13117_1 /TAXON_ID=629695 /ORGANISM="Gymnochlora sp., Strain CCMP2014" /LENGTH=400 /DNA_ID=CAMNT_0007650011 /DNA_START=9 /DNA_END=1208 /DNA_ORIENTATION=-
MEAFPYREAYLAFSTAVWAFESYLDYRQYKKYFIKTPPPEIKVLTKEEKFDKSQKYNADKMFFGMVSGTIFQIESTLYTLYFAYAYIWAEIPSRFGIAEDAELTRSLIFQGILLVITKVTRLPFGLYKTFVIEDKHGFKSKEMTLGLYFTDMIKEIALTVIIGAPMMCILIKIIQWGGESFYLYVWAFLMVFQFVMLFIYPNFIQPCFNKVEPLPQGDLKEAIEGLASRKDIDFPLKEIYQIDGSKRSRHSNAYMYGFCNNKRIVLFDTLIKQTTKEEMVAVLAHELGHWKLNHTVKNLCIGSAQMLAIFWLFSKFIGNDALYQSFGFKDSSNATIIGLMLFSSIYSPVEHVVGLLMTMWSRKCEFEADEFAVKCGYAKELRSGLIKLQEENLGTMVPDW